MMPNRIKKAGPAITRLSSVSRKLEVRKNLAGRTKAISRAAHRVDQLRPAVPGDLPAQPADMAFDDIGMRVEMQVPDIFQEHGARHDLAGMPHQIFEQPKLARLQLDLAVAAADGAGQQVDLEIADLKRGGQLAAHAAAERVDPSREFGKGEGLD